MIKISFSGISGSGKTSLIEEVKKILSLKSNVEMIPDLKVKNPFDSDRKSGFVSMFFSMSTHINEENITAMGPLDFILCDGSILDQWVLWRYHNLDKEMTSSIEEKSNVLGTLYRFWIKSSDLIFLVRTNLDLLEKREANGEFRVVELEPLKKMEELYKSAVQEDNLSVFEIWNNNTVDDSAHDIVRIISEYQDSRNG